MYAYWKNTPNQIAKNILIKAYGIDISAEVSPFHAGTSASASLACETAERVLEFIRI